MKLNIGSGSVQSVLVGYHIPLEGVDVINLDIDKKAYNLDINATVYNLPFNDNSFDIVYLNHVLEHLTNPVLALEEIRRIGKKVIVKVPNGSYYKFMDDDEHIFSWNIFTFKSLLEIVFDDVIVFGSKRFGKKRSLIRKMIFALSCLVFKNNELVAVCKK